MSHLFQIGPVAALRIASQPVETLPRLRLVVSRDRAYEVIAAEAPLSVLRDEAIEALFTTISGCEDATLRRAALKAKRRVYNSGSSVENGARVSGDRWPPLVANILEPLRTAERALDSSRTAYEADFAAECADVSGHFRTSLKQPLLVDGILLTSLDHAATAVQLTSAPPKRIAAVKETTLSRYLYRATTRPTPFGSFAGASLFCWAEQDTPPQAEGALHWGRHPQLSVDALHSMLRPFARSRLPVRLTLLRYVSTGFPTRLVFFRPADLASDAGASGSDEWLALDLTPEVETLLSRADRQAVLDGARALATTGGSEWHWREAIERLIDAGVLESGLLSTVPSPSGLAKLSHAVSQHDPPLAARLHRIGAHLATFASATTLSDRTQALVSLTDAACSNTTRGLVFEDLTPPPMAAAGLPVTIDILKRALAPVLALALASISHEQHQLMLGAFLDRYGSAGYCSDVRGFLVDLLRNHDFVNRLRHCSSPIAWLQFPFVTEMEHSQSETIRLASDAFDFHKLPYKEHAFSAFIQLRATRPSADPISAPVVLNSLQAGRGKYLSRYLSTTTRSARAAITAMRSHLADRRDVLSVEMAPVLGLNFQVHPRITEFALELPLEHIIEENTLRLSELVLHADLCRQELVLHASRLGRRIDPLHLGFLRDAMLPAPLLLLRALSPYIAEDTVAERSDIYRVLDRRDLESGKPLRRYRPRLEIGGLVLQRARWAISTALVPLREPGESLSRFFLRTLRWREDTGVPEQCFSSRMVPSGESAFDPRQSYVDWLSPLSLNGLHRILRGSTPPSEGLDYVIFTESLPLPEDAHVNLGGTHHVSELVVELNMQNPTRSDSV